ncbi:MAG: transporter substrate-binding domain-containing protein, partial [Phormidesmis sp.]
ELSRRNLQIPVVPLAKPLENQYRGQNYPRYGALLIDEADIECGPNSTSSLELETNVEGIETFGDKIKLSRSFYTTGIRLLLKKDTAKALKKADLELQNLLIAVLRQTTTLQEFEDHKEYYRNYVPYPKNKLQDSKNDVRDLALNALQNDRVQAFASDAPILQTLFKQGVQGEYPFRQDREPYEKSDYTIYPGEGYLDELGAQEYAIAIQKNTTYSERLRDIINEVIGNHNLSEQKQEIKNYESNPRNAFRFLNNWGAALVTAIGAVANNWLPIFGIVIPAAAVVAAAYLSRRP